MLSSSATRVTPAHSTRYAECYPGLAEMDDALGDSDEEADFSRMDQGNKKGPMSRFVIMT